MCIILGKQYRTKPCKSRGSWDRATQGKMATTKTVRARMSGKGQTSTRTEM